ALNIAKTFPELAAAIEAYKQENEDVVTTPSSKSTTRAAQPGPVRDVRDVCGFCGFDSDERSKLIKKCVLSEPWWELNNCLVELMVPVAQLFTAFQADHANLADVHYGLAIVDKWFGDATRKVPMEFVDEVMELEQVFRKRMDYGHHVALFLAALLDARYRHKPHNLTIDEVWAAEELAAKLASADGLGTDASGNAARLELLDTWLEPEYAVGMGLKMDRFAPDPVAPTPQPTTSQAQPGPVRDVRDVCGFCGFDSDERSKLIKKCVLSEPWWELNNCLVELMVPVAQLFTAFQADHANLADVHYGLAIVDKWFGDATRKVPMEFVDEVMELEQVFRKRMDYGHHVALFLAALLDARYRHKPHNLTIDEVWAAEELAAKLASADGLGTDASGNAARLELLDTWLEPEYAVGMGLKMDRFAPDPVAPYGYRYGGRYGYTYKLWRSVCSASLPPQLPLSACSVPSSSFGATGALDCCYGACGSCPMCSLTHGLSTHVMTRKEHHASAEAQEEWESFMAAQV
ncbi:hypothetical protein QJQ45_024959, partial [Haematococcus lacustris]